MPRKPKGEEIKIRVESWMKERIVEMATDRFTSESEIIREAILLYFKIRKIPVGPATSSEDPLELAKQKAAAVAAQLLRDEAAKTNGRKSERGQDTRPPKTQKDDERQMDQGGEKKEA